MPPPPEAYDDLTVFGDAKLRVWGDEPETVDSALLQALGTRFNAGNDTPMSYLAISGGGSRGAYAAGVLAGWTKSGTRPDFTVVTGISTGALIAPFAFLGAEYDALLREVYTTSRTKDIARIRVRSGMFGRDSLLDTAPLRALIETHVNEEVVKRIAASSRSGRVLLIGTTNLDAGRPVLWNITKIAESGHPKAAELIRDVILASASIPVAFPPVYIPVNHPDGNRYDEMHMDGGVTKQIFLFPLYFPVRDVLRGLQLNENQSAYLIWNDVAHPSYEPVKPSISDIAIRTIDSLIRTQGSSDLQRIRQVALREGINAKFTWLPAETQSLENNGIFDPAYMQALYDIGYERALNGKVWIDADAPSWPVDEEPVEQPE